MQRMGCSEFEKRTIFLEDHACLSDKDYGTPCTCADLIADGDSCGVDRDHVHEEARQRQDVAAPDQHIEFSCATYLICQNFTFYIMNIL